MPFRRPFARPVTTTRPGPRLLRAAATTAVVAGTATAVSGAVRRRQSNRDGDAAPPLDAPPRPEPSGISDDGLNRLERLAELKNAGVLSAEEFETQKAAILGTGP